MWSCVKWLFNLILVVLEVVGVAAAVLIGFALVVGLPIFLAEQFMKQVRTLRDEYRRELSALRRFVVGAGVAPPIAATVIVIVADKSFHGSAEVTVLVGVILAILTGVGNYLISSTQPAKIFFGLTSWLLAIAFLLVNALIWHGWSFMQLVGYLRSRHWLVITTYALVAAMLVMLAIFSRGWSRPSNSSE